MDEAMKKIRDELAQQYWNEFVAPSNRAHAEILFKDGFDAAMERAKILEEALERALKRNDDLDCVMTNTGDTAMACEIWKHQAEELKSALASFRGEK